MDWLACDCVQLFVSLFVPRRVGEAVYFFFVVIFGRQHGPAFVGLWWFVLLVRFGLFTALILECCSEIFLFVESLILAQDERWRRA